MSTVLASRNNNHHHQSSYMGEIPNYMNPNPNPNRNPKTKSKKIKHFSNNHQVKKDSAGDAYSFNQRPVENSNGFDCGGYVSYKVGSCSRSEINELRKKLVSDLERIRKLNDRIQSGEFSFSNPPNNSRSVNGKFKKVGAGNKRPLSSFREMGVNNGNGIGVMDEEMLKKCKQVLTKLMKHKMSWVFKAPVDVVGLGLHDYHQIIKRPMDLGTVKSNLSKGFYSNVGDFAADVRLVFENAMLYNPRTDDVHGMADQMLRIFEDLFRPIQAKLAKSNERGNGNGNERVGNVHGVGNNARVFDMANERVVNVNDMVNDVVNEVNRVNEFSAVDELDGSSWDDIQTPERTKKAKSEAKSSGFPVASKQIHSTASNAVNAVVAPVVHSPVRMPSRTPSPMQVTEPVKPSNTSTMTRTVLPKLPKPRAKDPNKREMNMEEKQKLGLGLQSMPPEKMPQLLQIIRKRNDQLAQEGDEIELDIEALDTETLWELDRFVTNWKKFVSKTKRQALMVNSASAVAAPSVSADIDDVPMSEKMDGVKKSKKDAGEEDVDIGDEMPESSFPHVEIEKDDGGGGHQGQTATGGGGQGNNDNNASSSSSGSSSSSSSGSSSSSDSDSGSSSGSDSDADDAQS